MRRTLLAILSVSLGIPVACSDRAPTSPEMGTNGTWSESIEASPLRASGRSRQVVVVPPRSDGFVPPGVWGSENAGLTIRKDGATLDLLWSTLPAGGCFGSYGDMARPIPNGSFSIEGTYTQLTGVYPGKIEYAARYSGVVEGSRMSIAIAVPALQQGFGPFLLTAGVNNAWSPCLFP
jgi:hypothetical protein